MSHSQIDASLTRDELYTKAVTLYAENELDKAEIILDNLVMLDSEDLESWLQLGLIREDKENYHGAIEAYSAILVQDDSHSNIWTNLAEVYAKMREHDKAEGCLKIAMETAITYGQPRVPIWNNYGALCAEVGRFEDAKKMFGIVLQLKPDDEQASRNLFEVKRLEREAYLRSLDAKQLAADAIRRERDPVWYYEYGTALRLEGNRVEAEAYLSKSIEMDPTNAWARYELALVYYRNRELEKAIEGLTCAVKLDSKNALFWSTLGTIYSILEMYDLSVEAHHLAVKLDPWDGRCWSQLGTTLLKIGRTEEAREVSEKAVKVAPNLDMAWNLQGVIHLERGIYRDAIHAFEKVLAINPTFSDAWNNIALAQEKLGKLDEAIIACRKGVELGPHRREAWMDLIKMLYRANRTDEANEMIIHARNAGIDIV